MNEKHVLLLGIGNVLWADEGFGVRCVEAINCQYEFPENVELMDGGTQGIYLVQYVQACDILIVFDAVDYGLSSGEMKILEDEDVPKFMGAKKISLHQTGFQEVLVTAELLGDLPEKIILIGVQPVEIEDFGGSLRPATKEKINPAIDIALQYLKNFDVSYRKRTEPLPKTDKLSSTELALEQYERGRPSASEACRVGDDRVLAAENVVFDPKKSIIDDPYRVDVDYRGQYDK